MFMLLRKEVEYSKREAEYIIVVIVPCSSFTKLAISNVHVVKEGSRVFKQRS